MSRSPQEVSQWNTSFAFRPDSSGTKPASAPAMALGSAIGFAAAWLISRSRPVYENVEVRGTRPVVVRTLSGGVGLGMAVPLP